MKVASGIFLSLILIVGCTQQNKDSPNDLAVTKRINLSTDEYSALKCYSKQEYEEDLDQLVDSISTLHPQPYEFVTKNEFLAFLNIQKSRINNKTTVGEFYAICRMIVAKIGCTHTQISQPANFTYPKNLCFPIAAILVDSSLIVCNNKISKLPSGTEIISINGKSISQVRKILGTLVSADGYNSSAIDYKLNSNFSLYYLLAFGFQSQFEIIAKNVENEIFSVSVAGGEMIQRPTYLYSKCQNLLGLEIKEESKAAILTIKTFNYYKVQFNSFKHFLDNSFKEIEAKKIENLIIDLRGNGGGDPYCGSYLLQFIAKEAFVYFDNPPNDSYKTLSTAIQPKADRYNGQVYILTDGGCVSTTGHICSLIKYHKMAQIIGEETGATYTCNASSLTFELSHTLLNVTLARNTYKTKVVGLSKQRGIIPDIVVRQNKSNIIDRKDPVIPFVLKLLK